MKFCRFFEIIGAALLLTILGVPRAFAQGSLHAWGFDQSGVVSNVPAGNDFVKVSLGTSHGLALRSNGTLVSWGNNYSGQVSGTPSGTYVDISAGADGSAALRADGTIVTWGYASSAPSGTFTSLASHFWYHVTAIRSDGTLAAAAGFVGLPAGSFASAAFDQDGEFGVGLRSDGELAAWGDWWITPLYLMAGPFRAVSAGFLYIAAIRADGSIAQWGDDWFFGGFPAAPSGTFASLASGFDFNVGLRTDGSLASWGYDYDGSVSNAPSGTGFIAVSASGHTAVAIHYEPQGNPDVDGDGLTDAEEALLGTNPNLADSDGDGLLDGTEVHNSLTNPLNPDTDGDGLLDGAEVNLGTNPTNPDSDGDGINDAQDPTPLVPGATSSWIEARLRSDAGYVRNLSLSLIDAPNSNAAKGRRNALANKLTEAANKVADGDRAGAIDELQSLLQKLDGNPNPPDWMVGSQEMDSLYAEIQLMINLLGQP